MALLTENEKINVKGKSYTIGLESYGDPMIKEVREMGERIAEQIEYVREKARKQIHEETLKLIKPLIEVKEDAETVLGMAKEHCETEDEEVLEWFIYHVKDEIQYMWEVSRAAFLE